MVKKQKHIKKGRSQLSHNNKKPLFAVAGVIILILIVVTFFSFKPAPVNAVKSGDNVTVRYAVFYQNKTLIDNGTVSFVVGSGRMIQGVEDNVLGMTVGSSKEFTVAPDKGYGYPNSSLILSFPLRQSFNKFFNISVSRFTSYFKKTPIENKTYKFGNGLDIVVLNINNSVVYSKYDVGKGVVVNSTFGTITFSESNGKINSVLAPNKNSIIPTRFGMGVIKSYNETDMVVDFNSPLAGKTLIFDVTLLNNKGK